MTAPPQQVFYLPKESSKTIYLTFSADAMRIKYFEVNKYYEQTEFLFLGSRL